MTPLISFVILKKIPTPLLLSLERHIKNNYFRKVPQKHRFVQFAQHESVPSLPPDLKSKSMSQPMYLQRNIFYANTLNLTGLHVAYIIKI